MLYEIIKEKYPAAILEYEIKHHASNTLYLDIAVPELKLNFEYDGIHWHDLNKVKNIKKSKLTDEMRDRHLKENGWKIFRFRFHRNPTREVLVEKIKEYGII